MDDLFEHMVASIKSLISQTNFQSKLGHALKMIVYRKIASDGYFDMAHRDDLPHGYELLAALKRNNDLPSDPYGISDHQRYAVLTFDALLDAVDKTDFANEDDGSEVLSPEEADTIIDVLKTALPKCEYKDKCEHKNKCERKRLIEKIFEKAYDVKPNIECDRGLIYDANKIEVKLIDSVSGLLSELEGIREGSIQSERTIFYRGQSDSNHLLLPSIMRTNALYENERAMYQQLMIECPDDFAKCRTHLERLSKMQHYQLHTRLLDVTRNPLVALYFACERADDRNGEVIVLEQDTDKIKDFDSDTVAVLASLPLFTREAQEEISKKVNMLINNEYCRDKMRGDNPCKCCYRYVNRSRSERSDLGYFNGNYLIHRLVHEVRQEKPGFIAEIVPCHLINNYFVQALKDTPRIMRQDGAFIICGLGKDVAKELHEFRYPCGCGKKKLIIVDRNSKENIRGQLRSLSIHSSSLMPEIENVAPEIVSNIKDQIRHSVRMRSLP